MFLYRPFAKKTHILDLYNFDCKTLHVFLKKVQDVFGIQYFVFKIKLDFFFN